VIGVGRTTLWKMVQTGSFPRSSNLGTELGYLLDSMEQWRLLRAEDCRGGRRPAPGRTAVHGLASAGLRSRIRSMFSGIGAVIVVWLVLALLGLSGGAGSRMGRRRCRRLSCRRERASSSNAASLAGEGAAAGMELPKGEVPPWAFPSDVWNPDGPLERVPRGARPAQAVSPGDAVQAADYDFGPRRSSSPGSTLFCPASLRSCRE
jgi:hypothetical protein